MDIDRTIQHMISNQLPSFPKSDAIRATFRQSVAHVEALLRQRGVALDGQHLEGLTLKLARYFAKRNWDGAVMTANLSTLADAIAPKPEVLLDPALTLKKIVSLHVAHSHEMAATVRRTLLANPTIDVPPAIFASSDDGSYNLVECRTQRHLQEETAALGHCVGGTHIEHYRDTVASGDIRIFSLRTAHGAPLATVEYDTKSKSITQIEGKPREISGKEAFFPALCRTLHALCERISVGSIEGLPHKDGKMLTKNGVFLSSRSFADVPLDNVLAGTVAVDHTTPQSVLLALCSSSRLTVDVTKLDLSRLPPRVKCALTSSAKSFHAPHLQAAGNISANKATTFSVPLLQTAGHIVASAATTFSIPLLRTAEGISGWAATVFSAPLLRTARDIYADAATTFSTPLLQTAGDIYARAATTFGAPLLRAAGNINVSTATIFSTPLLQTAGSIYADAATTFSVPLLQTAGYIVASAATTFSAPLLQKSGTIHASRYTDTQSPSLGM